MSKFLLCFSTGYFSVGMNEGFYNTLNFPNVPPHELKLKVGMECFVVRNLSPEDGLLNNTPVRVLKISKYFLAVEIIPFGKTYILPRITFLLHLRKKGIRIKRKQFPVRASYVKTINRAQGATLKKCGLDLREDPFAHGQLSVGLSRNQTRNDILILTLPEKVNPDGFAVTANVVYSELLM